MSLNNKKKMKPRVKMFMLIFPVWLCLMAMLHIDYYGLAEVPNFVYYLFGLAFIFIFYKTVILACTELKPFFAELKRLMGL